MAHPPAAQPQHTRGQAICAWLVFATAFSTAATTTRAADAASSITPSSVFAQAGFARGAQSYAIGLTWDWSRKSELRWGTATGYWESSMGQWRARQAPEGHANALVTQIGLTPAVRLHPNGWYPGWFLELGIGANVLFPIYRSSDKSFSTAFNFGDHIAVGRRRGNREFALRVQHFSNAGIKHPNPGEDFLQLRYSVRY
jgi:lipid A 3-O-deacylase